MDDNAVYQNTKLAMPVLAIGAAGSLGDFVAANAREYASDVTRIVVPNSGHWIYEEHPSELTQMLVDFL
jgi:pimeloyl-ACP methyl ester carboxylesterase